MENFVLYDELGQGDGFKIYKGRRKGTISYLAIYCVEKRKRAEITNQVRLIHEVSHENIVRFIEWYETSNHLWLVQELCTGGTLKTLLELDIHLPESAIRKFGLDLVKGLHHIHCLGLRYCDLCPEKIMFDLEGVMKYSDFGLCRVEGENLEELFGMLGAGPDQQQTADGDQTGSTEDGNRQYNTYSKGSPAYTAPEILQESPFSMESDLWSLGCVLFELYTGKPPFVGANLHDLIENILHSKVPSPRVKGDKMGEKPTAQFGDLLSRLLQRNPSDRMRWDELLKHPFWQGATSSLMSAYPDPDRPGSLLMDIPGSLIDRPDSLLDRPDSLEASPANTMITNQTGHGEIIYKHVETITKDTITHGDTSTDGLGEVEKPAEAQTDSERNVSNSSIQSDAASEGEGRLSSPVKQHATERAGSPMKRHLTFKGHLGLTTKDSLTLAEGIPMASTLGTDIDDAQEPSFSISSRPASRADTHATLTPQTGWVKGERSEVTDDLESLIYYQSDMAVTNIVDNPRIQKPAPLKYESKSLPVPPYPVQKIKSMTEKDRLKHLSTVHDSLCQSERGPPSQRRVHLLYYTILLAAESSFSNYLISLGILRPLMKQAKDVQHIDLRMKLCRLIGHLCASCTELADSTNLTEPMTIVTDMIRENFRNTKVKVALLPAIGEMLFLVARQEEVKNAQIEAWSVPTLTYTMLMKGLREGEDSIVHHYVVKIFESVLTTKSCYAKKLVSAEVAQAMWYIFTHSTVDSPRITAILALCRVVKTSVGVFATIVEKAGLMNLCTTMSSATPRVQQALLTMFCELVRSQQYKQKYICSKDLLSVSVKLLESPSMVIVAKSYVLLLLMLRGSHENILSAFQHRLVLSIERDGRRPTTGASEKPDHTAQLTYLSRCLDTMIGEICSAVPKVYNEILSVLSGVSGRKHPSAGQSRQLKNYLPFMPVLVCVINSGVLRASAVDEEFVRAITSLLTHAQRIDAGDTNLVATAGGPSNGEFIKSVMSTVESLSQHASLLRDHSHAIISSLLQSLADLSLSENGDTKMFALKLFTEMITFYLSNGAGSEVTEQRKMFGQLSNMVTTTMLPEFEQILLDQAPIPAYGFRLLVITCEKNPGFISEVMNAGLTPVILQVMSEYQASVSTSIMLHMAVLVGHLVCYKHANIEDLASLGLMNNLNSIVVKLIELCSDKSDQADLNVPMQTLSSLLDTIHFLLKVASDVVRKAIHTKKSGAGGEHSSEEAETVLQLHKPLTTLMAHLPLLLSSDEASLGDNALKILSLLAQLYGGEERRALSSKNMDLYNRILVAVDSRKQKLLLRILKRLLATDRIHALEMFKTQGQALQSTLEHLTEAASSHSDVGLSSLAGEVLKVGTQ